jgi:RNA polymerase sigma factor (sigma-70 family)
MRSYFSRRAQAHADDLVQLTMLACTQRRLAFRGESSFRAFLFGLARVELLRHYRRNGRRDHLEPISALLEDSVPGPEQQTAAREQQRLLLQALEELPDPQRTVVELCYWHELHTAEVARELGVPENTMYSRLHRAKAQLRNALQDQDSATDAQPEG